MIKYLSGSGNYVIDLPSSVASKCSATDLTSMKFTNKPTWLTISSDFRKWTINSSSPSELGNYITYTFQGTDSSDN